MLEKHEADCITQSVKEAEARTTSEIVVCIRDKSGEDRGVAAFVGLIALAAAQVLAGVLAPTAGFFLLLAISLAAGIAAFLICDRLDLGLKLLPRRMVMEAARDAARAAFLDREVDNTPGRNAVLLFVSRAERYVEILPDRNLAAAVPTQRWRNVASKFRVDANRDGMVPAIAAAVAELGAVCAGPFPATRENPDLLPDRPI